MMKDFGEQNDAVRIMWEDFKANIIEPWVYVVFGVIVGAILFGFIFDYSKKAIKKHNRNIRIKNNKDSK